MKGDDAQREAGRRHGPVMPVLGGPAWPWIFWSLAALLGSGVPAGLACSVPVFRYALERWPAAPYQVTLAHRGPLEDRQEALWQRLCSAPATGAASANLIGRAVNLELDPASELIEALRRSGTESLPALILRYPLGMPGDVWSAALNEESVQSLPNSPLRRRVAQRLLQGETAVWILVESGNQAQDAAAAHLLQTRLEHLAKILQPSRIEAEDLATHVVSVENAGLKAAFSLLRLARTDPAEQVLVHMLLGSEEDLRETKEPIAFPVFGRGRVLYALVGKGINAENIEEACSYLVGPCSCVVKDENPGFDLLLEADWDSVARLTSDADPQLPDLTGPAVFTTRPSQEAVPRAAASPVPEVETSPGVGRFNLRFAVVLSAGILLGGMLWFFGRKG